jgi:hypothetical protein
VSDIADRGIGGTTAQTHTIGETIRMNITAEHWEEMQSDIDAIIAAGAPNATTLVRGIAYLPRIETTSGTTHSLTTVTGERVMVWAKGFVKLSSGGSTQETVSLLYNAVSKDSTGFGVDNDGNEGWYPFSLMYTEIPTAGTQNITVTTSSGTLTDVVIMVQKI